VINSGSQKPMKFDGKYDIGFVEDKKFLSEWKDKYSDPNENVSQEVLLNSLELFGEFFEFLSKNRCAKN